MYGACLGLKCSGGFIAAGRTMLPHPSPSPTGRGVLRIFPLPRGEGFVDSSLSLRERARVRDIFQAETLPVYVTVRWESEGQRYPGFFNEERG